MARIPALDSGIRGFANALNRIAVKDKSFAQELAFEHGVRGNVTPKVVRELVQGKDVFTPSGKTTEGSKRILREQIKEMGLSLKATWDEIYEAAKAHKFKK